MPLITKGCKPADRSTARGEELGRTHAALACAGANRSLTAIRYLVPMKATFAATLALMGYDVLLRHGVGMHHLGVCVAAFFHSIGQWVYA